ncbi:MAG TPA: GGDEF domain-containing protein [Jatrophihabitantaceae bacterium]
MIISGAHPRGKRRPVSGTVGSWLLWKVPRRALVVVLTIEAVAVLLTVVGLVAAHPTRTDINRLVLLVALSAVYSEAEDRTDRIQRYRRYAGPYIDAQSVWTFAGVLLLPAGYAALLIVTVYAHMVLRAHRDRSRHPHRIVLTGSAVVLAALLASAVYHWIGGLPQLSHGAGRALGVLGAIVCYRLVNDLLVSLVIYLATQPISLSDVLLGGDELAVEAAMIILGAFTAQTVLQTPWLTPAVLVLVVVMYRGLLTRQLEVAATTDGKTELLNATAWRELAQRHLWRAIREQQAVALLVIDLDRFKALNDEHGHLAGDVALKAVADRIKHELRDYDAVGRYGGEEFVALLPNAGANAAMRVAERVRARIEDEPILTDDGLTLPLTGSVGVATYPTHGGELDALIRSADRAMYAAKDAGRNTVRLAAPSLTSHESQPASA